MQKRLRDLLRVVVADLHRTLVWVGPTPWVTNSDGFILSRGAVGRQNLFGPLPQLALEEGNIQLTKHNYTERLLPKERSRSRPRKP